MPGLEFFDFNSTTSEDFEESVFKCILQNEDTDTVLDLKKYVAEQQGLEDIEGLQILWQCIPIKDNILAKQLLDTRPGELFVSFPKYVRAKCENGGKSVTIFHKTSSGRPRWLQLEPGQTKTMAVNLFQRGKFGVVTRQIDEQQAEANMYKVQNHWKIVIRVGEVDTEVFKLRSDGTERLLEPWDTQTISTQENPPNPEPSDRFNYLGLGNFCVNLGNLITRVVRLAGECNEGEAGECTEGEAID